MGSAYMKKLGFIGMGNMAQALAMGFINAKAIAKENVYAYAPHQEHILLTGRDAQPKLIDRADLVTEMKLIKHPFQQGIKAQRGIEF